MTFLAVDGDIIAYRTAAVCNEHFEGSCRNIIDNTFVQIAGDSGISNMRVYLSGPNNFRKFIAKTQTYKGNRDTIVKPVHLDYCKSYMMDTYNAIFINGYEADDCIATDMTENGAIHCGVDKDIYQIAGKHFNYVEKQWREVTKEEAIVTLFRQVLMGDNSDNVPGLPGIGEKKASDFIASHETAFLDALSAYKQVCAKKLPELQNVEEYFIEQYNLIAMQKCVPLDYLNITHVKPWGLGIRHSAGLVATTI